MIGSATLSGPLLVASNFASRVIAGPTRRRRIWDLGESLHCSIIGTCLTTDEIRRLLRKIGLGTPDATDHAIHGLVVGLADRQDVGSKLLNKVLFKVVMNHLAESHSV